MKQYHHSNSMVGKSGYSHLFERLFSLKETLCDTWASAFGQEPTFVLIKKKCTLFARENLNLAKLRFASCICVK